MEKVSHNPLAIANYFLDHAPEKQKTGLLKLIKLCYIAHGFTLAIIDSPLVSEEAQAWRYGPVFPTIFFTFKDFFPLRKATNLSDPNSPLDFNEKILNIQLTQQQKNVVSQVIEKYGKLSGNVLSRLTHEEGTPWDQVYNNKRDINIDFPIISNEIIKDYYKKLLNQTTN